MEAVKKVKNALLSWVAGLVALIAVGLAWSMGRQLRVEHVSVPVRGLREPLRAVQLSDFHYDHGLSDKLLDDALREVAVASPDIVFLTGDYVDDIPDPIHKLSDKLGSALVPGPPVVAILGNHEYKVDECDKIVTDSLTRAGIIVAVNDVIFPLGDRVAVVGLADVQSGQYEAETVSSLLGPESIRPTVPRIVLSHNPATVGLISNATRADVVLSGHLHGGQVMILGIPLLAIVARVALLLPSKVFQVFPRFLKKWFLLPWDHAAGLHRVGDTTLYVNRGLGAHLFGRLWCPPELTVLDFTPASAPESAPASARASASGPEHS